MEERQVLLSVQDTIATITLNRPAKLNALNPEMLVLLDEHCAALERDPSVRVVVLAASGERAFCVGADVTVWSSLEPLDMWRTWIREGHRIFERLARLRQPVLALLNGFALGGGLELALAADIRIAAATAEFALPETGLGTIPGWGGTQRLPSLIGAGRAKHMILTGRRIDAVTAERWGLVTEVLAPETLAHRGQELARQIADRAPLAQQLAKQAVDGGLGVGPGVFLEAMGGALAASTADGREGVASFRERRAPRFSGS